MKAQVKRCSYTGCNQRIAFLRTKKGQPMPVDIDSDDKVPDAEDLYNPAVHTSHFKTCRTYLERQNAKAPGKGTEQEEGF